MEKKTPETSSPVDNVVAQLIEHASDARKGWVLNMGKDGKVGFQVEPEPLKLRDEYLPPADYRNHTIEETDSFTRFAQKYGTEEKSVVYISEGGAVLVIDESVAKGSRETIQLALPVAEDYTEWDAVFGETSVHEELLTFLREHEDNLLDPDALVSMSSIRVNSLVNYESDIKEDSKTLGIVFKSAAGEELKRFPKEFRILVPVLRNDEGDRARWRSAVVRLTVEMPDASQKPPTFTLFCPEWGSLMRERITAEAQAISDSLDGWLVVQGRYGTKPHEIKR